MKYCEVVLLSWYDYEVFEHQSQEVYLSVDVPVYTCDYTLCWERIWNDGTINLLASSPKLNAKGEVTCLDISTRA